MDTDQYWDKGDDDHEGTFCGPGDNGRYVKDGRKDPDEGWKKMSNGEYRRKGRFEE